VRVPPLFEGTPRAVPDIGDKQTSKHGGGGRYYANKSSRGDKKNE
jgi:hypothetical protein